MAATIDQTRPDHPIVSFCIPVYNNAKAAETIVKSLLSSDDSRFEVVVSDDNSQENVEELLSRIHDSRFRYYRNEKNLGAHKNWEHTLELGRGDWLYLIMGRDGVHGENISRLIQILEHLRTENITCLCDGYISSDRTDIYSGIDAMIHFIGYNHPTGTIFDSEIFRAIPERHKYFVSSDMYPENYVKRDMLIKGNGAFIRSGIYVYPSPIIDKTKIKPGVESGGNVLDAFYAPRRRTLLFCEMFDMIDGKSDVFSQKERDKFFRPKFTELLALVSFGWNSLCADSVWSAHYGHDTRNVSIREMLDNIFTAYKTVKSHLREKGTLTQERSNIIRLCLIKVAVSCLVKCCAKKILEPIGIWTLLKGLKRLIKG